MTELRTYDPVSTGWHRNVGVSGTDEKGQKRGLDTLIKMADLDFEVLTVPGQYAVNGKVYTKPNEFTAYRSDRPEINLGTYKSRVAWQNRPTIETFYKFCQDNNLEIDRIGSMKDGQSFFIAATIGEINPAADVGDITRVNLTLTESHKNGVARRLSLYGERLVCKNGMTIPVNVQNTKQAHVGTFDADILNQSLESALFGMEQEQRVMSQMANTSMSMEKAYALLMSAFCPAKRIDNPPEAIEAILNLFKGGAYGSDSVAAYNTAYGLLNAVTEYINHRCHNRGTADAQLESLIMPGGTRYKDMNRFRTQLVSSIADAGSDAILAGRVGGSGVANVPVSVALS